MDERQALRQATKLWPAEIDPEFGLPSNDIRVYLMQRGSSARSVTSVTSVIPDWSQLVRGHGRDTSWPAGAE